MYGRHTVWELINSGLKIERILILDRSEERYFQNILKIAQQKGVLVEFVSKSQLDYLTEQKPHQGIAAYFVSPPKSNLDDVLLAVASIEHHNLIVLDGIEDPQNFGAIIRTAEIFGSKAVIYPRHRAVGLTPSVIKASAGAAFKIPLIDIPNIAQVLRKLKFKGYWIYGLDPTGSQDLWSTDLSGKVVLVFGAEGRGLAYLTKKHCDFLLRIRQVGTVASLNVSACAAITLAEWLRQHKNNLREL